MPAFIKGEWQDGEVRGVNFLAGFRGMGKTTEMGRLMNGCSGTVIFYDHKGTHPSLLRRLHFFHADFGSIECHSSLLAPTESAYGWPVHSPPAVMVVGQFQQILPRCCVKLDVLAIE